MSDPQGVRRDRLALLAVFSSALCAYVLALAGTFVYADLHSVRDIPAIRSLAAIPSFFYDANTFSELAVRMYRPVLLTTFAFDHALGGGAAWAFKLTSVLVHGGCSVLLLSLARSLGVARVPAWCAATLFAVHPLGSEAVNMVSSRSDLLASFGLLLGLRAYVAARDGSRRALLGVASGAVIACGSKATGVMLPVVCVLVEMLRWRNAEPWRERVIRLVPAAAITLIYLVTRKLVLGIATTGVPQFTGGQDVLNGAGRDLLTQLCLMAYVLPRYCVQAVVPVDLTLDPWIPLHDDWASASVLCGWTAMLVLTALGLRAPRRRPVAFLGTSIAWLMALPWIVLPLNLPACEHRFYAPLAGIALVLAACLPRTLRTRWLGVGIVVASVFALLSGTRSLEYRDRADLWREVLRGNPRSVRGLCGTALEHHADAVAAQARGDQSEFVRTTQLACRYVECALRVYPVHVAARRNLAEFHIALGADGSPRRAVSVARELLDLEPNNPFYRLLLSRALLNDGAFDAAVDAALSCLDVAEPKGLVFRTAAGARARQGRLEDAVGLLDRSVARGLEHSTVLVQRAEYLLELGQHRRAERDLFTVLGREPFNQRAIGLLERMRATPPR